MNIDEIPTPETNAFMLEYNRAIAAQKTRPSMWDKLQSLERRLTVARGALMKARERIKYTDPKILGMEEIDQALTLTAPKQ